MTWSRIRQRGREFLPLLWVGMLFFTGCGGQKGQGPPGRGGGGFSAPPPSASGAGSIGLPGLIGTPGHGNGKDLIATFLDIGQGDSTLIETPNGKTLLIDAGPPSADDTIIAYLKERGITRLDYVVSSHPHNDHIGGMAKVFKMVDLGTVYDPAFPTGSQVQERYLTAIQQKGGKLVAAKAGKKVELDAGVTMEIVAPKRLFDEKEFGSDTGSWINNNSVVVRITIGSNSLLFTGDLEEKGRDALYETGADLKADILKVAHHGSHNGTDAEFLSHVQPKIAVISCATGNDYGHPHAEALKALQEARVNLLRTDLAGNIIFATDGKTGWRGRVAHGFPANATFQPGQRDAKRSGGSFGKSGSLPRTTESNAQFVGNSRSKIYHRADSANLPSPANRVYFRSEKEAEAAGYRPAQNASP